ncbi:MAG: efflux RND transporter periplasmic adaptor subunit [Candidatus Hydrogenedentes bacterium]|nr:efflux RND transporter periplasmic adaptor subunit [Candidatus Hydrogenedentota bacterium]
MRIGTIWGVAVLLSVVALAGCRPGATTAVAAADGQERKSVPVAVTAAARRTFEERVSAQGNVAAKNLAMIAARMDGTITEFFVDEGDIVVAEQTKLFQIDKVKVERAVAVAEQNLALAEAGRKEAKAQLASVQAQHDKAKIDFGRYARLREQSAIPADAVERADAALKVAVAGLDQAKAGVSASVERQKQAEASLVVARKTLSDSLAIAPMDGVVTKRLSEPGEFAGVGKPILRIVDPRVLEVSAFLPGETYARVSPGETRVRISVNGADVGTFPVSYKSAEIQPTLRTFEIKCIVENPPAGVAPGAIAEIAATLTQREGVGVPAASIVRRGNKDVIFTVENGTARLVEVRKGLDTDGWVELVEPGIAEGAPVITEGQFLVNDKTPVMVHSKETSQASSEEPA